MKKNKKWPLSVSNKFGRYYKAVETVDLVYYFNYQESDNNVDTIMYRKSDGKLVSSNYLTSNDLFGVLCDSAFTKISRTMRYNYNELQKELK